MNIRVGSGPQPTLLLHGRLGPFVYDSGLAYDVKIPTGKRPCPSWPPTL